MAKPDSTKGVVSRILENVRKSGDRALVKYSREFDDYDLKPSDFRITKKETGDAYRCVGNEAVREIKKSYANIRKFHSAQFGQIKKSWTVKIRNGITLGEITKPIDSVGCYVPGGLASYPSTVLMTCVPASVAGVRRIVVVSPPPISDSILVAADIAGADEIYRIGGAPAIGALAYGTKTIPKVGKIVGPGNKYVTAAKGMVYGSVDIDLPAGPSEILIIADKTANPAFIASDILAQAEHDPDARCVLLTDSGEIVRNVKMEIRKQEKNLDRKSIIRRSLKNSKISLVRNMSEAVKFANDFAPEHLEIMAKNPDKMAGRIENAGAIFIGPYSPVAAGDYATGANHVLPTGGTARFASPLSVRDFLKISTVQRLSRQGLESVRKTIETISEMEGLDAHAKSVGVRFRR